MGVFVLTFGGGGQPCNLSLMGCAPFVGFPGAPHPLRLPAFGGTLAAGGTLGRRSRARQPATALALEASAPTGHAGTAALRAILYKPLNRRPRLMPCALLAFSLCAVAFGFHPLHCALSGG